MSLSKGFLIALEGIDGSGKSTLVQLLAQQFTDKQIPVITTKEPGGTPIGLHLRSLTQEKKTLCPKTEFLLFAADRAQHMQEIIKPHLEKNYIVISDRMADSSLVYQGYGRGLDKSVIKMINEWAMDGVQPDITIYLTVDIDTAFNRIMKRKSALTTFEQEKRSFFEMVINGYNQLYHNRADVITINALEEPPHIAQHAYSCIIQRLNKSHVML